MIHYDGTAIAHNVNNTVPILNRISKIVNQRQALKSHLRLSGHVGMWNDLNVRVIPLELEPGCPDMESDYPELRKEYQEDQWHQSTGTGRIAANCS